jgi:hypothetical protein
VVDPTPPKVPTILPPRRSLGSPRVPWPVARASAVVKRVK